MSEQDPLVIVGAGPAGLTLALLLASNGIPVRVFERHKDFDREFRGEFLQPAAIDTLAALGVLGQLTSASRVLEIEAVRMHFRQKVVSHTTVRPGEPAGFLVHQPSLLGLLHERCSAYGHYRLDMNTSVTGFYSTGSRVRGVQVRRAQSTEEVAARLVVVCSGRLSALRGQLGLEAAVLEKPYTILWHRFDMSERRELIPRTLDGHVGKRALCVLFPTHDKRVQLMWRRRPEHALDPGLSPAELKSELLRDIPPHWHAIVADTTEHQTERQALRVVSDRLAKWWAPGVLLLGDAAHSMSPIGGLGLTMAIRDAVVASNHLVRAHRSGEQLTDRISSAVQRDRLLETEKAQLFQTRAARLHVGHPFEQWVTANIIIPLITRAHGASYMRELQYGWVVVRVEYPPKHGAYEEPHRMNA